MKYLIIGAKGQLAKEFERYFIKNQKEYVALSKEELDVSDTNKVFGLLKEIKPSVVLNCSAYNLVDMAQKEYFEAFKVNALGPKNLGMVCEDMGIKLVHYSTDYVFDGTKEGFYTEEDIPNPLNMYGKSKLMGEMFVKEVNQDYLIFRTSWVYGDGVQNFLYKLSEWTKSRDYLKIAVDEFSVPTCTKTLVNITLKAIDEGLKGLYHLTNSGYASRYEWAKKYFKLKGIKKLILPAYQQDFNLPAKRPKWSAMSNELLKNKLNIDIIDWEEQMREFLSD